jgi:preprotein translocase subunit SecA
MITLPLEMLRGCKDTNERKKQYNSDITYGTSSQFGFDYLRDNMQFESTGQVQRGHPFAIVDEADSIMVDEARTPLVISETTDEKTKLYIAVDKIVNQLNEDDYDVDYVKKTVVLTDDAYDKVEKMLDQLDLLGGKALHDIENSYLFGHVLLSLKAHVLFERDEDYIVEDDKVIIVDTFTGRPQPSRRFSDGLHQAIEAKENVSVLPESRTLASVTLQNFLRLYNKLSGMTGTALTEAEELRTIYGLEAIKILPHKPIAREDEDDEIYMTEDEKLDAIVDEVKESVAIGQPVLIGTPSVEKSEGVSNRLLEAGIEHAVLNAKQDEREAEIVADAGMPGRVTVATNMAGRGTDIKLGGNADIRIKNETANMPDGEEKEHKIAEILADVEHKKEQVLKAGGLYVIASERHDARRIDNQLRGRSGRQGEKGRSKFFLSLDDTLMRGVIGEKAKAFLKGMGLEKGEVIKHRWISKSIEKAQKNIEGHHFDIRKQLLQYDDMLDKQRHTVYARRNEVMTIQDSAQYVERMYNDLIDSMVDNFLPEGHISEWNDKGLEEEFLSLFSKPAGIEELIKEGVDRDVIVDQLKKTAAGAFETVTSKISKEALLPFFKKVWITNIDQAWRDHIMEMDHVKGAVHLRAYAQQNPLIEFKKEAHNSFEAMSEQIAIATLKQVMSLDQLHVRPAQQYNMVYGEMSFAHDKQWSTLRSYFNKKSGTTTYSIENLENGIESKAEFKGYLPYNQCNALYERLKSEVSRYEVLPESSRANNVISNELGYNIAPDIFININPPKDKKIALVKPAVV